MEKKLVALALLSAFSVAASAQSSVSMYGVVDLGLTYDKGAAAGGSTLRLESGLQSGSRLGFRGTEDLGGGLSALFTLESGIRADTGTFDQGGLAFGRQAFVGVKGGYGTVKFGHQHTPIYVVMRDVVDPFGVSLAGAGNRLMGSTNLTGSFASRTSNTVNYTISGGNGLSTELAYTFGEQPGDSSASRQIGAAFGYNVGPAALRAVYHQAENATATNTTRNLIVGGTYDLKVAKIHLGYGADKNDTTLDHRNWLLGATVPLGTGTLLASYVRKNDRFNANADADLIAVGYSYTLSKRTNLYTSYGVLDNEAAARYGVAVAGTTDKLFNVGVRHTF